MPRRASGASNIQARDGTVVFLRRPDWPPQAMIVRETKTRSVPWPGASPRYLRLQAIPALRIERPPEGSVLSVAGTTLALGSEIGFRHITEVEQMPDAIPWLFRRYVSERDQCPPGAAGELRGVIGMLIHALRAEPEARPHAGRHAGEQRDPAIACRCDARGVVYMYAAA